MDTWHELARARLLGTQWHEGIGMTASAALGKLVLFRTSGLELQMFDLHAPLDGSPAEGVPILHTHYARYARCRGDNWYNQRMQARFLEDDPRNLLVVAWSACGSGLQVVDVITGEVVQTLSRNLEYGIGDVCRHLGLAVTKGCIVVQASAGLYTWRMGYREKGGHWHRDHELDFLEGCLITPAFSLSFGTLQAHEPCRLLELVVDRVTLTTTTHNTYVSGSGEEPLLSLSTKDGLDFWWDDPCDPLLVQTSGLELVLALVKSDLVKLDVTESAAGNHVAATTVLAFDKACAGATYVPGLGLLVLCSEHHDGDDGLTLHTLARTTMSAARDAWMRACVRRRSRAR
jgi:hypothetical protein